MNRYFSDNSSARANIFMGNFTEAPRFPLPDRCLIDQGGNVNTAAKKTRNKDRRRTDVSKNTRAKHGGERLRISETRSNKRPAESTKHRRTDPGGWGGGGGGRGQF